MAHGILTRQNDAEHIRLLQASAVAYRSAKTGEIVITFLMLFLSVAFPISYIFLKDETAKLILFGCSFSIAVSIQIVSGILKDRTSKGAIFKEEFDTSLFGLPWKSTLRKPDRSDILHYSNMYSGDEISDWYSPNLSSEIPDNTAVAVFQHTNTSWDIQLRRQYRKSLIGFLIVYSTALIAMLVAMRVDPLTIFLLLFSLLSFYTHFISLIRGHTSAICKREFISAFLDDIINKKRDVVIAELRDVQDEIYVTRQESAKVPNFFFRWYKKRMNEEAEQYIESVNSIYMNQRSLT